MSHSMHMSGGNSTSSCVTEVRITQISHRRFLLTQLPDGMELECHRLLLPLLNLAHHQQRHVRRILCRHRTPRRMSRVPAPRRTRIRCLSTASIPATTTPSTSHARRCHPKQLLRRADHWIWPEVCDVPRERTATAGEGVYTWCYAGLGVSGHVAGDVLQWVYLHQCNFGCCFGQVSVRLDGCAYTDWQ
jgi:hypothetical protein